ncbi:MAG: tRNA lysidine(34) synthetase TilS [Planctomycetota bacterium]|nr:tRNA lysidine(34) synthetase TilS [Planctomycetota bacterium]
MSSLQATVSGSLSRLLPAGVPRFIVALSGGPDSVAILSLCNRWSHSSKGRAVAEALHVHHGIRGAEADRDARHCARICSQLGIPLHIVTEDVEKKALAASISIETAGREVRRARYVDICKARSAPLVITGQHGDDQAETVLGNLLRGCGLRGLRGMEPVTEIGVSGIKLARPLLGIRKSEILQHLERAELASMEDSTNQSDVYRRNRLRLETIPSLQRENPDIVSSLMSISVESRRRWEILQSRIDKCLAKAHILPPRISLPPGCWIDIEGPEIADLLRSAVLRAFGDEGGLVREHLNSLEKLATGESRSASLLLPGARKAIRCGGWIHIGPATGTPEPQLKPFQISPDTATDSLGVRWLSSFSEPLTIRSLEQGEKIPGRSGSIEELLRIQGVPPGIRQNWPLAVDQGGQIRWFAGYRNADREAAAMVSVSIANRCSVDELCYHLLRTSCPESRQE